MNKSFHDLTVSDVSSYPIWRFTNANSNDDYEIESVDEYSLEGLMGLIVTAEVEFGDSSKHLALHQNVSLGGPRVNDHFLSLTMNRDGSWFPLARYHDVSIGSFGPQCLADFMGKTISDVFPIKYDLREVLNSDSKNLVGFVRETPLSPLTDGELISLSLL